MLEKIKKIPIILGILSVVLIIGIVYAADYHQVNSEAQVTIDEHTVCKKVTNNNALAIFVPTKTADEWAAFRSYASGISLGDCGYYCDEDNDSHYTKILVDCPSGRISGSVGDDCDDDCNTCYPDSTAYTLSPDGLDQDCDEIVDETTVIDCTIGYGSNIGYGYTSTCAWGTVNVYRRKTSSFTPPTSPAAGCELSGGECTSLNTSAYTNCSVGSVNACSSYHQYRSCSSGTWYQYSPTDCPTNTKLYSASCQPAESCTPTYAYH